MCWFTNLVFYIITKINRLCVSMRVNIIILECSLLGTPAVGH